jgi:hypothetical protein
VHEEKLSGVNKVKVDIAGVAWEVAAVEQLRVHSTDKLDSFMFRSCFAEAGVAGYCSIYTIV